QRHNRLNGIGPRSAFLRLMTAGIDGKRRRVAGRAEMSDPGIVGNHKVGFADNFRRLRPVSGAGEIDDPSIPAILLDNTLELTTLHLRADENHVARRPFEQYPDELRIVDYPPVADLRITERRNDDSLCRSPQSR